MVKKAHPSKDRIITEKDIQNLALTNKVIGIIDNNETDNSQPNNSSEFTFFDYSLCNSFSNFKNILFIWNAHFPCYYVVDGDLLVLLEKRYHLAAIINICINLFNHRF